MAQILGKFSSSPVTEDDIAQFADVCQRYIDEVREADATYAEQDAFNDGPEMTSLAETMTTRLNLNGSEITTSEWKGNFSCIYEGHIVKNDIREQQENNIVLLKTL